eukprot:8313111-Pyramimonas_sp.AAC.1
MKFFDDEWSNHTIDKLRYTIASPETESKGVRLSEGSTNEVKRSSKLCHVNFGCHTDWARDCMIHFDAPGQTFESFSESFKILSNIAGIGAFRA